MSIRLLSSYFTGAVRRFHDDERGTQSIETVVILGIAAVVAIFIFWLLDTANFLGEGGIFRAIEDLVRELFRSVGGTAARFLAGP